jgi:hypothetical protein
MKQLVGAALGLLLQWLRIDAIIAVKKARFAFYFFHSLLLLPLVLLLFMTIFFSPDIFLCIHTFALRFQLSIAVVH